MRLPSGMARVAAHFGSRTALARAYREVFAGSAGHLVLTDLLRSAGVLEVATVRGDPAMTHFNDGRRSLGLLLIERLRWSEGELLKLAEDRARASAELAAATVPGEE